MLNLFCVAAVDCKTKTFSNVCPSIRFLLYLSSHLNNSLCELLIWEKLSSSSMRRSFEKWSLGDVKWIAPQSRSFKRSYHEITFSLQRKSFKQIIPDSCSPTKVELFVNILHSIFKINTLSCLKNFVDFVRNL